MSFAVKIWYILKVISVAAWVTMLPVTYACTSENLTDLARTIQCRIGNGQNQPSLYILAGVIYLSPNMLGALLFLFSCLRWFLERSNYKTITRMMWWSQLVSTCEGECMKAHSHHSCTPCSGCFLSLQTWHLVTMLRSILL